MSSRKTMRRSVSTSNIPSITVQSATGRKSRLPVLNQDRKSRGRSLSRALDYHLPSLKRAGSGLELRREFGSLSVDRQTLRTPLGQSSGLSRRTLLSSSTKKREQLFNKQWQSQEVGKVRQLAVKLCPDIDPHAIKCGISVDIFIILMDVMFKRIDKRITITKDNYVESVPAKLKTFRYPAVIKSSMMKAVYIPQSWPHVLGALSFLTDTINALDDQQLPYNTISKLIDEHSLKIWNLELPQNEANEAAKQPCIEQFQTALEKEFNMSHETVADLQEKLDELKANIISYKNKSQDMANETERINKEVVTSQQKMKTNIDNRNKIAKAIKDKTEKVMENIDLADEKLSTLNSEIHKLKSTKANQKWCTTQVRALEEEIKDLEQEDQLQTSRQEMVLKLSIATETKFSELRREMQRIKYQYNDIITQLKSDRPSLAINHISESPQCLPTELIAEMQIAHGLVKTLITEAPEQLSVKIKNIKAIENNVKQAETVNIALEKHLNDKSTHEAEIDFMVEHSSSKYAKREKEYMAEVQQLEKELRDLQKPSIDLVPLKKELKQAEERSDILKTEQQTVAANALAEFKALHEKGPIVRKECMGTVRKVVQIVHKHLDEGRENMEAGNEILKKALHDKSAPH